MSVNFTTSTQTRLGFTETIDKALRIFVPMLAEDQTVTHYRAHIKNVKLFKLVIGQVALGSSFRLALWQITCVREALLLGYLSGCNEATVSWFVCVAAAACLQKLSKLLKRAWAFSIAFDSATVESTSYFDVRVRFSVGITLHCFHVFSLPLFGRHTGNLMFDVFKEAMDAILPQWEHLLLSTCSDGARNMMGRVRGIVTRIAQRSADAGHKLIRFWCGAHQLDLVIARFVGEYCDASWYGTLTSLIGYLG